MKNLLILTMFIAGFITGSIAQPGQPVAAISQEKIGVLSGWIGTWKGEGTMMIRGEKSTSQVEEKIEPMLDNTVLLIQGKGTHVDAATKKETIVHQALGVLSYDQMKNTYKLNTFLKDGKSGEGWFKILGDNNYQWGFETPIGQTRYTVKLDPAANSWYEMGEFSRDGSTWNKFFEMNLTRVQ